MSPYAPGLLDLRLDGPIAFLHLDDGRGNALGRPMLEALERALNEASTAARVLVISGREKIFSGGLDLPQLIGLDRPAVRDFLDLFNRVFSLLLGYPRPIVTAARGAGVAGGAILLCAGDERLVTPNGDVGISEVALGVSFPTAALELVRVALGEQRAAEAATWGRLYRGEERLRMGFATEVVPPEAIDARARELATERARLDPDAVARVRLQLRRAALERVAAHGAADNEAFLDRWFAPATQERLKATVERLRSR